MIHSVATPPPVYRKRIASHFLGVSVCTIDRLARAGELVRVKIGPQATGITRESMVRFFERRGVPLPSGF